MTTRSGLDANINAFWAAAGPEVRRPTTPKDLLRRKQIARLPGGERGSANAYPPTGGPPSARSASASSSVGATVVGSKKGPGGRAWPEEFREVEVDLSGREGYNAEAVNGTWLFWRVVG